jgi:hypothetical protein
VESDLPCINVISVTSGKKGTMLLLKLYGTVKLSRVTS